MLAKDEPLLHLTGMAGMDTLLQGNLGLMAEARRCGLKPDIQNKTGYQITLETMRLHEEYLEAYNLPNAATAGEKKKVQDQVDSIRKSYQAETARPRGVKKLFHDYVDPINAATLYGNAQPVFEKAEAETGKTMARYRALMGAAVGVGPGKVTDGDTPT